MHTSTYRKLITLTVLMVFLVILSACTGAPAAEEPAAATEEPAQPVEPSDQYPVQYGQDSRTEPFQHPDSKLKDMAASVGIFVRSDKVQTSGNSVSLEGYTLNEMSEMGWLVQGANVPMCSDELFTSQIAPGYCTGFLVGEDILVTAGHCLQRTSCADASILFGFQMESSDSISALSKENLYKCKAVLAQEIPNPDNQYLDYAIIQLDRSTRRPGLGYVTEDRLPAQSNVAVLGYPSGLPLKIASNAFVMSNDIEVPYFVANLDTFGSNSGSPVINMDTYQVEGILTSGTTDYVLSDDGSCVQVNRCPEGGGTNCGGENATKMARLTEKIPDRSNPLPNEINCFPGLLLIAVLILVVRVRSI